MSARTVSLTGVPGLRIVDALEAEGIRDDLVALFATGDHIDRQAWEDLTHNDLEQARSVVDALDHIGWRCGDPTGTLRDVLDDWTAGLEAAEAAWQDDRRRDLAWARKAWTE